MNVKRMIACMGAVALFSSLWLSGCMKKSESSVSSSEVEVEPTVPPLLNVDISTILTKDQVSSALGVTVGEPQIYDSGTSVNYSTDDAKSSAEISMMECDKNKYDETVNKYSDAADSPNLGESAKWSPQNKQLLTYKSGYMISVTVDVEGKSGDSLLLSARQLAALVLEKLG